MFNLADFLPLEKLNKNVAFQVGLAVGCFTGSW